MPKNQKSKSNNTKKQPVKKEEKKMVKKTEKKTENKEVKKVESKEVKEDKIVVKKRDIKPDIERAIEKVKREEELERKAQEKRHPVKKDKDLEEALRQEDVENVKLYDKDKLNAMIIVLVSLVVLMLLVVVLFNKTDKNNNDKNETKTIYSTEESIERDYNFSKQDAIELIKKIYNSDNYDFSASAEKNNTYLVVVTNTDTNVKTSYSVDPASRTYIELED